MSVASKGRAVVQKGKEAVDGTVKVAKETNFQVRRAWYWAGRLTMMAAATIPGAAAAVGGINLITRATKQLDFIPSEALPNAIGWGHDHAVSMLDSSNVASQAAGVVVGAESTAAHLADIASAPGEFVGDVVGGWVGHPELGEEIGGGAAEAVVAVVAGKAAWELSQRVPTVAPKPVAPPRG